MKYVFFFGEEENEVLDCYTSTRVLNDYSSKNHIPPSNLRMSTLVVAHGK